MDGTTYDREKYKGFVTWLLNDGRYVDSPALVKNNEYILTPSNFTIPNVECPFGKYIVKVANAYVDTLNNIYIPGNDEPIKKGQGKTVLSEYVNGIASELLDDLTKVGTEKLTDLINNGKSIKSGLIDESNKQVENIRQATEDSISELAEYRDKTQVYITDKINGISEDNLTRLNQLITTGKTNLSMLVQKAELLCDRAENSAEYKLGAAKEASWELLEDKYPEDVLELPVSYIVGTNSLILSYGGFLLYKDTSYKERGVKNSLSSQIILNMKLPKGAFLNAWVCPAMNEDYFKIMEKLDTATNLVERLETVNEDTVIEGEERLNKIVEAGEKYTGEIKELFDRFSSDSQTEITQILDNANQQIEAVLTTETERVTQLGEVIKSDIEDKEGVFQSKLDENLERSREVLAEITTAGSIYQGKNLEATMTLPTDVGINSILELPIYYIVGCNTLRMSYDNRVLYKDIDYVEVGQKDKNSWKVKMKVGLEAGHRVNVWSVVTATMSGVIQEVEKYKDCVLNTVQSIEEVKNGEDGFYLVIQ